MGMCRLWGTPGMLGLALLGLGGGRLPPYSQSGVFSWGPWGGFGGLEGGCPPPAAGAAATAAASLPRPVLQPHPTLALHVHAPPWLLCSL